MLATATSIVGLLTELLPLVGSMTSGAISNSISLIEQVLPVALTEATDLVAPIQNIIAAYQNSGTVTAAQLASLAALDAQCDAAFESAATADGLPATPAT